jgi:uncharacterized protein YjbI with pentapeptide repeats
MADMKQEQISGERPDLSGVDLIAANLREANLSGAHLSGVDLFKADLSRAKLGGAYFIRANLSMAALSGADLSGANLREANLVGAYLIEANLGGADLIGASLSGADLSGADLGGADLIGADLIGANLSGANLREADLSRAGLLGATLSGANLGGANLSGANLIGTSLVNADITNADLTGCRIYGVSAWGLKLNDETNQRNLIITKTDEPEITVDDIEVAQFVYLLLNNAKIRNVIDTITSKAVLILGRFTDERKAVLDALRDQLRKRDYLPILFDFDKPANKDLTGTVTTLANIVRFIIADGTDPKSIPHELATIVPTTMVPVKPILLFSEREYAMFRDLQRRHRWVLPTHRYKSQEQLIADLDLRVIRPAEKKAEQLRKTVST